MSPTTEKGRFVRLVSALLVLVFLQASTTNGANILGVFTSYSPSHLIVHMSEVRALAERGHNITVVTSLKPTITHENIHNILIPPAKELEDSIHDQFSKMAEQKNNILNMVFSMFGSMSALVTMQADALVNERFTRLYENSKFDLVILGYFLNDFQLGVAAKFKCPLILSWTGPPMEMVGSYVGNPAEIAYVPSVNMAVEKGQPMSFLERLKNMFGSVIFRIVSVLLNYQSEKYYRDIFSNDESMPPFAEIRKNVSILFTNSHFSEGPIRPNVPAVVEIGGIQIKDVPNPLPKDIAAFLNSNSSKQNGAILFSLGSNIRSSHFKADTNNILYNVFSSLKQNVIWKWEDPNNTPGNASNIFYHKWLPQDDILAHPNLKLFITHAGKGGFAEAQYHNVPMVALPIFGDQQGNADYIVKSGYGLRLDIVSLNETEFKNAILEVLNNPVYRETITKFSKLYKDRPLTAKQTVVYWTEYVLRHHGAAHIQSPLLHLNWIQTNSIDVIGFLCLLLYLAWRILKITTKLIWKVITNLISKKTPSKKGTSKSKKVKSS